MLGMNRSITAGLAVLVAVALATFLAAACNGGGGGDGGGSGDAALGELAALAEGALELRVGKVTYKVTTEGDGEAFEGEWLLARRPPDSRFEFSGTADGEEFRTIIISADGRSYLCVSRSEEQRCFETESPEADTEAMALLLDVPRAIVDGIGDVELASKTQRLVAGEDATCFAVSSAKAGLEDVVICFSEDGQLLYLQTEVEGARSTFEATSVSTDVTDEDFVPPYEIEAQPSPAPGTPSP